MARQLVILGRPGAGKSTQAARLADQLGLVHLSTGGMLRRAIEGDTELGRLARPYVERGELVPDEVMRRVVDNALAQPEVAERGFVLDGFPRTAAQAEPLLATRPGGLDAAIDIELPAEEARRRLLARGRDDDRAEVIDHRLVLDAEESGPLLNLLRDAGLLIEIDGVGSEDEIFDRILAALDER